MPDGAALQDFWKWPRARAAAAGRSFNEKARQDPPITRALVVIVIVALITLAKQQLPFIGEDRSFLLFFGGIMLAAWYGRMWSGFLATILSAIAANYFFVSQGKPLTLGAHDIVPTLVFCFEGALISVLCQSRHRTGKALLKSERINRAILDSLVAHIAVIDRNGKVITVNQAWENFGRDNLLPDDSKSAAFLLPGVNYLDACHGAFDDLEAQKAFDGIRSVLSGQQPQFALEYPCHSPTEERWFLLSVTPLARYEYSEGGAVVSHLDISARRRAEVQRIQLLESERRARENAEAANRSKDEFFAVVSHELRTPLHSILGWAQILKEDDLDEATQSQAIEIIERNARTQSQLVNDLLDASRIITGKMSCVLVPLKIQSVMQAAILMMQPQAHEKNIRLEIECLADPRVMGDQQRLQQAIWNLIQNAIKFSPDGGKICISLDETTDETANRARICVTDEGIGIAAEFLPRVFERFQQADATRARKHGGMGLGLAIVHHVVELHDGTTQAFSDGLGKGARFVLELPILEEPLRAQAVLNAPAV